MEATSDMLISEARALRSQIADDRRANEAHWTRVERVFEMSVREQERALDRRESRGLVLAFTTFSLGFLGLIGSLQATSGKSSGSWSGSEALTAAALLAQLLAAAGLMSILWTLREGTRRSARLTLRLRSTLEGRDGAADESGNPDATAVR